MGRATSKGNQAKSKMKQLSDMPTPRFEHGWCWSVVQHATARPQRRPICVCVWVRLSLSLSVCVCVNFIPPSLWISLPALSLSVCVCVSLSLSLYLSIYLKLSPRVSVCVCWVGFWYHVTSSCLHTSHNRCLLIGELTGFFLVLADIDSWLMISAERWTSEYWPRYCIYNTDICDNKGVTW